MDYATENTPSKPKIGLALGSGVAKGFAHIGVIRALKRHGIEPNVVAGTSIGAVAGGAYLANKMDALEEWALSLNRFKLMSYFDFSFRSGGLMGGKKLFSLMEKNFSDLDIEDLSAPFIAIATDMTTGHEVWIRKGSIVEAMRASFSLPGVFAPVLRDNRFLLDGALVNPIPVSACRAMGAQMVIAINLGGDMLGKARQTDKLFPRISGFDLLGENHEKASEKEKMLKERAKKFPAARRLFSREQESPSMFGAMMSAMNIAQDRLARSRMAGDPPDVLISPRIGNIGMMEFDRAEESIKEGEIAVERSLPYIMDAYSILIENWNHVSSDEGLD